MKLKDLWAFMAAMALSVVLFGAYRLTVGPERYKKSFTSPVCISKLEKIKTVGGCDKYGYCGVITETSRQGSAHLPVVGGVFQVESCEEPSENH